MGSLTTFLQHAFAAACPDDWICTAEQNVVSPETGHRLGYTPRADVLLARRDGTARLWIEFEVSRADPVANHAKFATAALFEPRPETDAFVSMVSSHVQRGRHNLAATTVYLMRSIGLRAYQTLLIPQLRGDEVQLLNHTPVDILLARPPFAIDPEVDRALAVSRAFASSEGHRIHFASNFFEVMLNVRCWNEQVATAGGAAMWGRRTVTFFVHDAVSRQFAPSKFCAFVPVRAGEARTVGQLEMDVETYVQLDETETRFDGAVARSHLVKRLGMTGTPLGDLSSTVIEDFRVWHKAHSKHVHLHPRGPVVIQPPPWWG